VGEKGETKTPSAVFLPSRTQGESGKQKGFVNNSLPSAKVRKKKRFVTLPYGKRSADNARLTSVDSRKKGPALRHPLGAEEEKKVVNSAIGEQVGRCVCLQKRRRVRMEEKET